MIDIAILCPLSVEYNSVREYLTTPIFKEERQFGLSYEAGKIFAEGHGWQVALFETEGKVGNLQARTCLLYTSPSPRDRTRSRMPSSA